MTSPVTTTQAQREDLLHSRVRLDSDLDGMGRSGAFYKALIVDAVSVLLALALGFSLSLYFAGSLGLIWMLLVAVIYITVAFLGAFLGGPHLQRVLVTVLQAIALVVWLPFINLPLTAAALAITWGILISSETVLRRELLFVTKIRFFRLARPYISNLVTLSVLLLIAFYLPGVMAGQPLVSTDKLDALGDSIANVVHLIYPSIPPNATAGDVASVVVERQLQSNPAYAALTPSQQTQVVERGRNQLLTEFSSDSGVRVRPDDRFGALAAMLLQNAAEKWRAQYGAWFLVFWLVVTFIIIRSMGFIFSFLAAALAYVVYSVLLSTGAIVLQGEHVMREVATFS